MDSYSHHPSSMEYSHSSMESQYAHGSGLPMMPMMESYKRKLDSDDDDGPPKKRQGRRKIKIEFIEDKSRRQITFSKRKAGIMKKAYELTTLTGTQALLLIASETGHVYTFATSKLQPFVTHQEGKALIQRCLNSPESNAMPADVGYSQGLGDKGSQMPDEGLMPPQTSIPEVVESTLVLLVGKQIPVVGGFCYSNMADLRGTAHRYSAEHPITSLAGGFPSTIFDMDQTNNTFPVAANIVVGVQVAEVDYTSEHQPAFSIENLRQFLAEAPSQIPNEMWHQISSKPYVSASENLIEKPYSLFVVSTYQNAYVNVVFGVRKVGDKGHQVVGISCMPPDNHVCHLDVDENSHSARLDMTTEVDGLPLYHLLPELKA